jgi:sarcosine oxidase
MPAAIVVGAGVLGASAAWRLAVEGWEVTLVEQAAPGHDGSASGGETRLLRSSHGADAAYTRSSRRGRTRWRELEAQAGASLFVECGLGWLAHREDGWERDSEAVLRDEGVAVEPLDPAAAGRLWPGLDPTGLAFVLHEPDAGVLRAAPAVRALARAAAEHGARIISGRARPDGERVVLEAGARSPRALDAGARSSRTLEAGARSPRALDADARAPRTLEADAVVWACGPWLGALFPDLVALRVTRQEVFFFTAPSPWRAPGVPAWVDYDAAFYGHPDLDGLGVKACSDTEGPALDPEAPWADPVAGDERVARAALAARFPALAGAPLVRARACAYELTPDTRFLLAPHPRHARVWLLGGGSGHAFKHGPVLGDRVAALLAGREKPDPALALGARAADRSLRTGGVAAPAGPPG